MSIKHPTAADLAHLRDGHIVEARFGGVTRCGQVRLHQANALMLDGWTVRSPDGEPGVALDELISPLPPTFAVDDAVTVSGGNVVWCDVPFSPDEARHNADTMRKVADRLCEAADEAERLPDGVYRVSFPDGPEDAVHYRDVLGGRVLGVLGDELGSHATIHERIGDIPTT